MELKESNKVKEHTIRIRVDENTKYQLEQINKSSNMSISEVVRKGIEEQYNSVIQEEYYVKYKLYGFNNLKLTGNIIFDVNNKLIKSIYLQDDLKILIAYLHNEIVYSENIDKIELYLNHICFNLITQTDVEISQPVRILESVKDSLGILNKDKIMMTESIKIQRQYEASEIYKKIVDSKTALDKHELKYERIFRTLHNPNKIIQFISLYQYLMELLSIGKKKVEQKNVTEHFRENKYSFISFYPTRRSGINFEEDIFTYTRNEIAHCENTNDLKLYEELGNKVTSDLIKKLVSVINDVILETDIL